MRIDLTILINLSCIDAYFNEIIFSILIWFKKPLNLVSIIHSLKKSQTKIKKILFYLKYI